jgi:hypothetical protein
MHPVRRKHHSTYGHFVADKLWRQILALSYKLHFRRDDARAGLFELRNRIRHNARLTSVASFAYIAAAATGLGFKLGTICVHPIAMAAVVNERHVA